MPRNIMAPLAAIAIAMGFAFEPGFSSMSLSQFFDMATLLTFTAVFWRVAG